ncbi:DUF378 domain-containing protein [bacterium (Candidatus Howlettbacteria) CG_4_10_14_0_8_um_filter_40_9]|nr:MAG: DUF378 domain-containing protein [bacterium (Candidatus Howlettbacteria) CG_4_10_14_0_8_um_filter_40_9]
MKMNPLEWIAFILVIIGALNWGLIGVLEVDLVKLVLGDMTLLSRAVYTLVGISGIYLVISAASKKMN